MSEERIGLGEISVNVIDFPMLDDRERRLERIRRKRYDPDACSHLRFVVDDKLRTVACGACGQLLDPVTVLLEIADAWGRTIDDHKRFNAWRKEAAEKAEAAKKAKAAERELKRDPKRQLKDTEHVDVRGNVPYVRHSRITVSRLWRHREQGWPIERILQEYPGIGRSQVDGAIAYAEEWIARRKWNERKGGP